MQIAVVILAGGEGTRMGGGKPFRLLCGQPLLNHALDLARRWSDDVAISARDQEIEGGTPVLRDAEGAGPIAGIAGALRFARDRGLDAVLTIPCDVPLLPDDLPAKLTAALTGPVKAAIPESGKIYHPASALWAAEALDALPAYLATGRRSLMGFAERIGFTTVQWPVEPFDQFFNVNTPKDLAEAETLLKSR